MDDRANRLDSAEPEEKRSSQQARFRRAQGEEIEPTGSIPRESGSPVSEDYGATGNAFTGRVHWVQIDVGDIDPEHHAAERQLHLEAAYGTQ